jgi:murein L,D-transpeptidase YcbB/YkuD
MARRAFFPRLPLAACTAALAVSIAGLAPTRADALPLQSRPFGTQLFDPLGWLERGVATGATHSVYDAIPAAVRLESGLHPATVAWYAAANTPRWVQPDGTASADLDRALAFLDLATAHGIYVPGAPAEGLRPALVAWRAAIEQDTGVARLGDAVTPRFAFAFAEVLAERGPTGTQPSAWVELADATGDPDWAWWRQTAAERIGEVTERRSESAARLDVRLTDAVLRAAFAFHPDAFTVPSGRRSVLRQHTDPALALLARRGESLDRALAALVPSDAETAALVGLLDDLRTIQRAGGWRSIPASGLREERASASVALLRDRLALSGYALSDLGSHTWDEELLDAVQAFQRDHRLRATRSVDRATLVELNRPVEERIAAVILSLENLRSGASRDRIDGPVVRVNIPDFHAELHIDGAVAWRWRTIVGRVGVIDQTPEMVNRIRRMEFNPMWYPTPRLAENLRANDRAGVVWRGGRIVQLPGPANPLGRVKFLFPNSHAVYMHDTNEPRLFNNARRTHSSGCVRVDEALELAAWFLSIDRSISLEDGRALVEGYLAEPDTVRVDLEKPIDVLIEYRLVRAATGGTPEFFPDVYRRAQREIPALVARADVRTPPSPLTEAR